MHEPRWRLIINGKSAGNEPLREPVASTRFQVECVPRRVRMHLPPGCPLLGIPGNPLPLPAAEDVPEPPPVMLPA